MANAVRFKAPWYRDSQQNADIERSQGVHFLPSDEERCSCRRIPQGFDCPLFSFHAVWYAISILYSLHPESGGGRRTGLWPCAMGEREYRDRKTSQTLW